MLLWDVVVDKIGATGDLGYVDAMLVTITLWLVVAPLAAARRRKR